MEGKGGKLHLAHVELHAALNEVLHQLNVRGRHLSVLRISAPWVLPKAIAHAQLPPRLLQLLIGRRVLPQPLCMQHHSTWSIALRHASRGIFACAALEAWNLALRAACCLNPCACSINSHVFALPNAKSGIFAEQPWQRVIQLCVQ